MGYSSRAKLDTEQNACHLQVFKLDQGLLLNLGTTLTDLDETSKYFTLRLASD